MPDLGKYAVEVTLAYGVSLALLVLMVLFILRRAAKSRAVLADVEAQIAASKTRAQDGGVD